MARLAQLARGDSFNTAVYLARAGLNVGFATAVGDDPYSDSIVALALAEGLGADLILRVPGRLPALSLVEHGQSGKSVSRVWGDGAPARELFELTDWMRIAHSLISARLIYFSGITLSLYSNDGLGRLFAALEVARQQGAKVAFDGNFRPAGWKGNLARTRTVFMEALKRVDIALPAFDDERPAMALTPVISRPGCRAPSRRRRQVRRTSWRATSSVIRVRCCRAPKPPCTKERMSFVPSRRELAAANMPDGKVAYFDGSKTLVKKLCPRG